MSGHSGLTAALLAKTRPFKGGHGSTLLSRLLVETPSAKDRRIIGDLLQTLHETEEVLDQTLVKYFLLAPDDPEGDSLEELISLVPLRDKADFARKIGLLDEQFKKKLHSLCNRRNGFAHRRVKGKKPNDKFAENEVSSFKRDAAVICGLTKANSVNAYEERLDNVLPVWEAFIDNLKSEMVNHLKG